MKNSNRSAYKVKSKSHVFFLRDVFGNVIEMKSSKRTKEQRYLMQIGYTN